MVPTGLYKELNQSFEDAERKSDEGSYHKLLAILNDLEGYMREYIQDTTQDEIKKLLNKLRNGGDLTRDELQSMKLWIVGDAAHYTRMENNFDDWTQELKRLTDEINCRKSPNPDLETAVELRALLQDGIRLLPNIIYFLQEKSRVNKFHVAAYELDRKERAFLIELLKEKMVSKEM
jgi:hypothetical protein